ncbi:MAG: phytanoyl-CoA dioxygenase family protein [Gammaproteobacteria bacterium]
MILTKPTLLKRHRTAFLDTGYLVLRQAFRPPEVDEMARWADELLERPERPGSHWVYWEPSLLEPGRKVVSRIENIAPFHEGFRQLSEVLKGLCDELFGEPAVLFKEKINYKMPGGDGFKPHQDSQAGWEKYAKDFISVLVSIDKATVENGCLQMVRGFHRQGLYREWEPLTEQDMAEMQFFPCPTDKGDIVMFDSYTPHASAPNRSNSVRRIYFATYNRLSAGDHRAAYYADKHQSYPPDIEREPGKEYVFRV